MVAWLWSLCHNLPQTLLVLTALLLMSKMGVLSAPKQISELTLFFSNFLVFFPNTVVLVLTLRACGNRKMPLFFSVEQVSRRQLGVWLGSSLLNYLTMLSPPLSWMYWAKAMPFGCSWAHCSGKHISLLVNKAVGAFLDCLAFSIILCLKTDSSSWE